MTGPPPAVKIGLEVHVYVRTRSKMFCACPADFLAAPPNTNVCPVCTGQPGAKPMAPNAAAIRAGVELAQSLGAKLAPASRFHRKHYFYPDLPNNYQRTSEPFCTGGSIAGVDLTEVHWEEDPGAFDLETGLVDYNRSGAPLLEIVTEPQIRSPEHARDLLSELRLVLAYLGAWREEAGVKADCNVSVAGGERAEVKNVNSTRNVERALAHEVERQSEAVARGEKLPRETRHFDEASGRTVRLRTKETVADYRYLPDPDLHPVDLSPGVVARWRLAETPLARRARLAAAIGAGEEKVSPLLADRPLLDALEAAAKRVPPAFACEFFLRDVRGELEFRKRDWAAAGLAADDVAALLAALHERRITPHVATRLLRAGLDSGGLAAHLAKELSAGGPETDLDTVARDAVRENPRAVEDFRKGKETAVNFLVGAVMKKTRGRAEPGAAREAVLRALSV